MIEIECTIKSVIFLNNENGYAVLNAKEKDGKMFTLVFNSGMIDPKIGFNIIAHGDWVMSPRFGRQFVSNQYEEVMPTSIEGIVAYLSCGIFKGIGEKMARRITDAFGTDTIKVIDETPERLNEVKGIGKSKIESILTEWTEHKNIQEIVTFFTEYGLTINMIMKIYKQYGNESIELVKQNPYRLASDIDGIGFRRADGIAMKLGISKEHPNRIRSCIVYVLTEESENGHTFLYFPTLIEKCNEYLTISNNLIEDMITEMLDDDDLKTVYGNEIFLPHIYYAEKNVASKLARLHEHSYLARPKMPLTIEDIEREINIQYNDRQKETIETAIMNNVMVLTGGPGTGKTTVLLGIIKLMQSLNRTIACAAPTGRAAKRMSELTKLPAKTIHRLLEYNPAMGYQRNEENPLHYDVIIVDEVSMVNIILMDKLLKAVQPTAKVILVGDENQLPCIGAGNVLHDIIASEKIPVVILKEIFRQAEGSRIITNAHNIINNKPIIVDNTEPNTDFFFLNESNPDKVEDIINDLVTIRLPKKFNVKPIDIQVLSPRRKDVKCCADELNKILQRTINDNTLQLQHGSTVFKLGDKVMQIKNNYEKEVFNGDVGFIVDIDPDNKLVVVDYDDGFKVTYENVDLDEIILAYASTIHKSQGSEYPIVVIPMLMQFSIMLKRNLIYTGITRAKQKCIIVGDKKALSKAISDDSVEKRNTMLTDWLEEMIN